MDGMITAGRVGGLFGNKGELTLILFESFPRDPNREEPVFVEIDGHAVPLFFDKFARRGVRGATVVFADIDTEARALELVGREFYIRTGGSRASGDGNDDELYFEDMVGWEAEMGEGLTGRITAFFDSEHNPLLEITIGEERNAGGESVLIPAQEEFFAAIDEDHRRVTFDLPEGLLELNS
jgi:16S rRNA processing protein RimM